MALPVLLAMALLAAPRASSHALRSPNQRLEVRIEVGDRIRYGVYLDEKPLLRDATLSMRIDGSTLGAPARVRAATPRRVEQTLQPPVRQRSASLRERFHELRLDMQGGYAVVFRAYDEGVAYRIETSLPAPEVKVQAEEASFRFAGDWSVFFPQEEGFMSHNERSYDYLRLKDIPATAIATLPAVVDAPGVKIAIAESDVEDYPGLWLQGTAGPALRATFPAYPLQEKLERDRDLKVTERADYIAVTKGTRAFPWRIIGLAEKDGDLLTNPLVYLLAKPSQVADTSWIRPGKVAWDWWNANNLHGVGFKSGVNTQTYKYYIDFASRYGIEYIILDEGWYVLGDVMKVAPEMDMDELTAYARQKNVGIILWLVWKTFDDKMEEALDRFERWGIKGLKVDFMQRDDQPLVNFYHKVCREAAKRKMLVDFHGAQKPATMTRTWPNLISTEGVRGLEWVKWSDSTHPEHDVTLPFTRMFLGPMDYTPGAMRNATKRSFAHVFEAPMSMGTRCHQLAMYVVFESPLQMLADSPSSYLAEPEIMEFLGPVPTVWDETRVLDAKIADYVVVARRHGRDWYLGAMTDWTARDLDVDLAFLPDGRFELDAYQDGVNADRWASDYSRVRRDVDKTARLKLHLAEGGGWAAVLHPKP
ncbi:MAG: alpha-glucosidase [Acidobacteria bacterium]|nr:MAG: alpha-glucosidase [Acidobacteriota bacterium]